MAASIHILIDVHRYLLMANGKIHPTQSQNLAALKAVSGLSGNINDTVAKTKRQTIWHTLGLILCLRSTYGLSPISGQYQSFLVWGFRMNSTLKSREVVIQIISRNRCKTYKPYGPMAILSDVMILANDTRPTGKTRISMWAWPEQTNSTHSLKWQMVFSCKPIWICRYMYMICI